MRDKLESTQLKCAVKLHRMSSPRRQQSSSPRLSKKMKISDNERKPLVGKVFKVRESSPDKSDETKISDDSWNYTTIPNSVHMTADNLVKASRALGTNGGKISTSVYSNFCGCKPPPKPATKLVETELTPPTASVYIHTREEAFSPHLLNLCLKHPIVLVRNLAPACDLDLSLYTTKTLVDLHPNHPVEIRNQIEQHADENLDPSMTTPVWYCTSSRSHTTIAKYSEYQAGTLAEAWDGTDTAHSVNPTVKFENGTTRRMIKFGTNCDLSDEKKWGPQLKEIMKLPAWARVVSPSNMLSHMGHQILGMNTVQLYMKVPCARTPGHQENNNFCAVNINIGPGDSEWFGVPNEYWGGLQRLCKRQNVDYLHGSWWPTFKELQEAGIPCYRFMQRPGDLVWVNAGCVHWVQAAGWCNNIAWNVGPLSHRQYVLAIERYEWNKVERFQSIVAMVLLTWNLARNIRVVEPKLFYTIKGVLSESLRQIVQTLDFVKSIGAKVKFHGRRRNDPPHYCAVCEEEVFNTILIRETEIPHVVHCFRCAFKIEPSLKGWICLEEYTLEELCRVYDEFQLGRTGKLEIKNEEM